MCLLRDLRVLCGNIPQFTAEIAEDAEKTFRLPMTSKLVAETTMPILNSTSDDRFDDAPSSGPAVPYGSWFLRVLTWDGILAASVLLLPGIVEFLFPNQRGAMELAAVVWPIVALFVRFFVARRHIDANACSLLMRRLQLSAVCVAIFVLLMIDSLVILAHEMPRGAMVATPADMVIWALLIVIYLAAMTFAMYPGRVDR